MSHAKNTNPHKNPNGENLEWRLRHNELTELYLCAIRAENWAAVNHYEAKLNRHMAVGR